MEQLISKYQDKIQGVLSCYDRIVIQGTLHPFCYAEGMTGFLYSQEIRIFDYAKFAFKLRDDIKSNVESIANKNDLEIDYIKKNNFRKEARISEIIKNRGDHPGIVHIFSALEPCTSYKPWYDKNSRRAYLKYDSGKCLHYYIYIIHPVLGLCYVRVPTWCPFRLQVYFNGHNWLSSKLTKKNINHKLLGNAFIEIDDFKQAQEYVDKFEVRQLHKILDDLSKRYCPIIKKFELNYHWSIMQAEYSTDIVFANQSQLQPIYSELTRTAIHAIKPENITTFLGKKLHGNTQCEIGNNFSTRIEGTCIKHRMGSSSIKMYDKFGLILRIESTTNDVTFFKHYRTVEHRDGTSEIKLSNMKKGIYSLAALKQALSSANNRYLEFISTLEDKSAGINNLNKISKNVKENNLRYKGFNFFAPEDENLFLTIARGEFNIRGFQNKDLQSILQEKTSHQISRTLKRLRTHGLIKKVSKTYRYYLTRFGRKTVSLGLRLKELVIVPALS